jgi:hypothetical protein
MDDVWGNDLECGVNEVGVAVWYVSGGIFKGRLTWAAGMCRKDDRTIDQSQVRDIMHG